MMQHTIVISLGGRTRQLALSVCRRLRGRKASYLLLSMLLCFTSAQANPTNPHVVAGGATFAASNNLLEISNLPGTIINWQDFSIASDEITRFIQQSASSAVLN
ncbi:MAG: hypothetical protein KJP04_11950, partial [Arenicella sp.]|nr:hypothetical protein [Arenicella sp.]